jgi:hypothetical protein
MAPEKRQERPRLHGNVSSKSMAAQTKKTKKPEKAKAKWVYTFGGGKAEGRADMRDLLGGKGAGLAEMANFGAARLAGERELGWRGRQLRWPYCVVVSRCCPSPDQPVSQQLAGTWAGA